MIVIDKLCYQSKLRYENAGEKFAFAVLTLLICVVNRHQVVRFQEILARFPDTFACVSSVNETWGNFKHVA